MLDSETIDRYDEAIRRIEELVEMARRTIRDDRSEERERLVELDRLHRLILTRSDQAIGAVWEACDEAMV